MSEWQTDRQRQRETETETQGERRRQRDSVQLFKLFYCASRVSDAHYNVSAFKPSFTVPHVYQLYTRGRVPLNRPSLEQLVRKYSMLYLSKWNEKNISQEMIILYLYTFTSAPVAHKLYTQSYVFILAIWIKILLIDTYQMMLRRIYKTYQMLLLVNAALRRKLLKQYLLHWPLYTQARGYFIQTLPCITLPHLCCWAVTQISPQQQIMQYS